MDRTRVESIVEDVFPDTPIEQITSAKTGNLHNTYLVDLDSHSIAIKGGVNNPGGIEPSFDSEPYIIREVYQRTDLPVPKVIRIAMAGPPETQYFITEKLPGEFWLDGDLPSPDESESLVYENGRYLGMLHNAFDFENYGAIQGDEDGLVAVDDSETWSGWFEETVNRLLENLAPESSERLMARTREFMDSAMDAVPTSPPSKLIHYDYRLGNMLIEGDQITGILDWEGGMAGHAFQEFVKAEYLQIDHEHEHMEQKGRLRDQFYRGYHEFRSTPADDLLYRAYRTHVILWTMYGIRAWGANFSEREKEQYLNRLGDDLDDTLSNSKF